MGAWDTGVFDNDSALDWLDDIITSGSLDTILIPLKQVVNREKKILSKYVEEPLGSECLAAAEIIATSIGKPGPNIPLELCQWVEAESPQIDSRIVQLAATAVRMILTASELRELWEESEEYSEWLITVNDLEKRLVNETCG